MHNFLPFNFRYLLANGRLVVSRVRLRLRVSIQSFNIPSAEPGGLREGTITTTALKLVPFTVFVSRASCPQTSRINSSQNHTIYPLTKHLDWN